MERNRLKSAMKTVGGDLSLLTPKQEDVIANLQHEGLTAAIQTPETDKGKSQAPFSPPANDFSDDTVIQDVNKPKKYQNPMRKI